MNQFHVSKNTMSQKTLKKSPDPCQMKLVSKSISRIFFFAYVPFDESEN